VAVNASAFYGTGIYGESEYGVINAEFAVTGVSGTGAVTTVSVTGDANFSTPSVSASATTDPDVVITADATHSITSVQGVGAASTVGIVGVAIHQVTGVEGTGENTAPTISGDAIHQVTGVEATGENTAPLISGDANFAIPEGVEGTMATGGAEGRPSTVVRAVDYGGGFELTGTVNATLVFVGEANITPEAAEVTGSVTTATISGDANFAIPVGVSATTSATTAEAAAGATGQPAGVQAVGTADPDVVIEGDATHTITSVQGVSATGGVGDIVAGANIDSVPSVEGTGAVTTSDVSAAASTAVTGVEGTGATTTATIASRYLAQAVEGTGEVTTVTLTGDANFSFTGVSATIITDQPDVITDDVTVDAEANVSVTGVEATGSVTTVSIAENAQPTFTGVSATGTAGTVTISETQNVFDVANRSAVRLARVPPAPPRIVYVGRAA